MSTLENKVVVITGASSGIGKAAAATFAKRGSKLVLAARRIDKLDQFRESIGSADDNCICVQTDVTKEEQVIGLFDEAQQRGQRFEITGLRHKLRRLA
jgi:NADP-dependent 3-hydroxy acid dehydrogenase YdfG